MSETNPARNNTQEALTKVEQTFKQLARRGGDRWIPPATASIENTLYRMATQHLEEALKALQLIEESRTPASSRLRTQSRPHPEQRNPSPQS